MISLAGTATTPVVQSISLGAGETYADGVFGFAVEALPNTGLETGTFLGLGLVLLIFGALVLLATRRPRDRIDS
jgi:LPXTG-motif cell wall-anchored protein